MPDMPASPGAPVITMDGPSGSGKGTVAQALASRLAWHYLESGALYRTLSLLAQRHRVALADEAGLAKLAGDLNLSFRHGSVWYGEEELGAQIRTERIGAQASQLASLPAVRAALLGWQRQRAQPPGLVADGRDMGTVVFPNAACKIFLTASAAVRAQRRFKQLQEKGFAVTIEQLLQDIQRRDRRDMNRAISPLRRADDAFELDTTALSIEQAVEAVCARVEKTCGFGGG